MGSEARKSTALFSGWQRGTLWFAGWDLAMPRSSFPDNVALVSVVQYCGYPKAKPLQLHRSLLCATSRLCFEVVPYWRSHVMRTSRIVGTCWKMLETVLMQLWIHEFFSRWGELLKPRQWPRVVPSIWLRTPSAEMPPKRWENEGGLSNNRTPTANSKTKLNLSCHLDHVVSNEIMQVAQGLNFWSRL